MDELNYYPLPQMPRKITTKDNSLNIEKLSIAEGEWIITIPINSSTISELANVIYSLRNRDSNGLTLKAGWQIKHI